MPFSTVTQGYSDSQLKALLLGPAAFQNDPSLLQAAFVLDEIATTESAFLETLAMLKVVLRCTLRYCESSNCYCAPLAKLQLLVGRLIELHQQVANAETYNQMVEKVVYVLSHHLLYAEYSVAAQNVAYLVRHGPLPLRGQYLLALLAELEKQGGRLDYSLTLLLQKTLARIAKYPLFLLALAKISKKLSPQLIQCKQHLRKINDLIAAHATRDDHGSKLDEIVNFHDSLGKCSKFYGSIQYTGICTAAWVTQWRQNLSVNCVNAGVILFEHSLMVVNWDSRKKKSVLVLVPYSECDVVTDVKDYDGGLFDDTDQFVQVRFRQNGFVYEMMLAFQDHAAHQEFLHCLPHKNHRFARCKGAGVECHLPENTAALDVDLASCSQRPERCYFKKVVRFDRPVFRRRPRNSQLIFDFMSVSRKFDD